MRGKFLELWKQAGNPEGFELAFAFYNMMYSMEHRKYHNWHHINQGLSLLEEFPDLIEDPLSFGFAWFSHDYFCCPGRKGEELRSAQYLKYLIKDKNVESKFNSNPYQLVIVTDHKTPPETNDQRTIIDMDLFIFGQKPDVYDEYAQNVHDEYKFVLGREDPVAFEKLWRDQEKGRPSILRHFLNRAKESSIYYTDAVRDKYEVQAVENLDRELKDLGG